MSWTSEDVKNLSILNVFDHEVETIKSLLEVWRRRWPKNVRRSLYYDTEQAFKDLGIALPPQLKQAKFVLGWGTQAVKKPAMRSQFEGLRLPGSDDPFELGTIFSQNRFALEFSQANVSACTHGMSLVTVARGRDGEAPVQIQAHSAEHSAALWDRRKRRLGSALTVSDLKGDQPTEFVVYLPHVVLECKKTSTGWLAKRYDNTIGRVLAVPVSHDPQLRRPFGRSRLTNSVMALCDMAVRAYVRMEANAEFYSTPQIALLGVDPESFDGQMSESMKFKLAMDRLLALTKDQDGEKPELTQLSQASMSPHSDMLRTVAMAFSGETGIPPSSLGIIHDQPASAEAIRANEHDMLVDVSYQNKFVLSDAVREIAILAVMVRDGLKDVPDEAWSLSARFADPEFQSLSAQSDAVQKLAPQMPVLAQYPVLLEQVFDDDQVARIQADQRRSTVSEFMRNIQDRVSSDQVQSPAVVSAANAGVDRQVEE